MQMNTPFDYLLKLRVGGTDTFDNSEGREYAPSVRPSYKKLMNAINELNKRQGAIHFVLRSKDDVITVHRISDGSTQVEPPAVDRSNNTGRRRPSKFKQPEHQPRAKKPEPATDVAAVVAAEVAKALAGLQTFAPPAKREPRTFWIAFDPNDRYPPAVLLNAADGAIKVVEVLS